MTWALMLKFPSRKPGHTIYIVGAGYQLAFSPRSCTASILQKCGNGHDYSIGYNNHAVNGVCGYCNTKYQTKV